MDGVGLEMGFPHGTLFSQSPLCVSLPPRGNLLPNLTAQDIRTCRFHPVTQPFCPILRLGDIVRFAGQDFAKLASTVRFAAPPMGCGLTATCQERAHV